MEGKPEDVKAFCQYFLFDDEETPKQFFARSFIHESKKDFFEEHIHKSKDGRATAQFGVEFAWSAHSCLIEGYPDGEKCITLMEACKRHKVNVDIDTEEPGMAFEEHYSCNDEGKLTKDECENMPEYECKKCKVKASIPTSYPVDEYECWECNTVGEWK